jgi:hypothetical protein
VTDERKPAELREAAPSSHTPDQIVEACASIVDECNREGPYQAIGAAGRIRALKGMFVRIVQSPPAPSTSARELAERAREWCFANRSHRELGPLIQDLQSWHPTPLYFVLAAYAAFHSRERDAALREVIKALQSLSSDKACGWDWAQQRACRCCHKLAPEWQMIEHKETCEVLAAHNLIRMYFPVPNALAAREGSK